MGEKGKFSDAFNSLNNDLATREKVLECSNRLKKLGIDSPGQINRIYKSGDFLAFNDPLKIRNLEMFGIDNNVTDQIFVAEVMDRTKGHMIYEFVNTSEENENKGIKRGDILTLDPDKEGKENGTEFSEEFKEYLKQYCIQKVEENEKLEESEKQLIIGKIKSNGVDITSVLGIKTYEDIIYIAAKTDGLERHIMNQVSTPENKKEFVKTLNREDRESKSIDLEDTQDQKQEEQEEGMTIEEAAEVLGIEEEKLREVAGDASKILGIKKTSNVESLSRQLGHELDGASSEVIMLKVAGPGIKSQGVVLTQNGDKIYSPEEGDTTLITELVEDGANGDSINDIDQAIKERNVESKKITTINPLTGKEVVEFAEAGNEKSVAGYESESKLLTQELAGRIKTIMEGPGERSEKLTMVADVISSTKGRLENLQVAYNITEKDGLEELERQAADAQGDAEVAKAGETVVDAGKTAVQFVATAFGKNMFEKEVENSEEPEAFEVPGKRTH